MLATRSARYLPQVERDAKLLNFPNFRLFQKNTSRKYDTEIFRRKLSSSKTQKTKSTIRRRKFPRLNGFSTKSIFEKIECRNYLWVFHRWHVRACSRDWRQMYFPGTERAPISRASPPRVRPFRFASTLSWCCYPRVRQTPTASG